MNSTLSGHSQILRGEVSIGVAQEKKRLEEHHAARPNCRGPAECRKDHARNERLNQKEQARTQEDGEDKERALQALWL